MPCYTPDDPPPTQAQGVMTLAQHEAVLCGILTKFGAGTILPQLDWVEIGVDQSLALKWWKNHLVEDATRRNREAKDRSRKQLRQQALSKLTPEERKALKL